MLCLGIAMIALLRCAHGQTPPSKPAADAIVAQLASAAPAERDAILVANRPFACDLFHVLLHGVAGALAGKNDAGGEEASALAGDVADRCAKLFGIEAFKRELAAVADFDDEVALERWRATCAAHERLEALRAATSPEAIDAARSALIEAADRMAAFAKAHRDRETERFGCIARTAAMSSLRGPDGEVLLVRALGSQIDTFERHGLAAEAPCFRAGTELARLQLRSGQTDEAGATLERVRRPLRNGGTKPSPEPGPKHPPELMARLLSLEIEVHRARGFAGAVAEDARQLESLLPGLVEAATSKGRTTQLQLFGDFHFQVAVVHSWAGAHDAAAALLRKMLAIPALRPGQAVRAKLQLARECEIAGDIDAAGPLADEVLEGLADVPDASPEGPLKPQIDVAARTLRARIDLSLGDAAQGLACLQIATERAKKISSCPPPLQAELAMACALYSAWSGDLEDALRDAQRALDIFPADIAATERVQARWLRAKLLLALGEAEDALGEARAAIAVAEDAPYDREFLVFGSEVLLAQVLLSSRRAGEALARLDAVVAADGPFLQARPAVRGQAERLRTEARWQLWSASKARRPRELETLIADAEAAIADIQGSSRGALGSADTTLEILKAWELIQEIEIASGRDPEGARALAAGRAWHQSVSEGGRAPLTGLPGNEARAILHLLEARTLEQRGRREDAAAAYRKAARLEDRLRERLRFRAPDGLSARFESIRDRVSCLLAESAVELHDPARALELVLYLEESRARSLKTLVAAAEARNLASLTGFAQDGGLLAPARLDEPPRLTAQRLETLMVPGRAVLAYAVTGRGVFVIGLRGTDIRIERAGFDREALEWNVHGLLQNLQGDPNPYKANAVADYGHALWQQLVAPMAPLLEGVREIVLVPDDVLFALPFAVLLERPFEPGEDSCDFRGASFFGKREGLESLSSVPCLGVLALLQGRAQPQPGRDALLVADPASDGTTSKPLPAARDEVRTIAGFFPSDRISFLEGADATRVALERAAPGDHAILHLAAHTRREGSGTGSSALLLAPDEKGGRSAALAPGDIAGLKLRNTTLVVLSSCDSALGRIAGGEGVLSLPRAFLIAGARTVVAAAIEVQDRRAPILMTRFYRRLLDDKRGPGRAMLAAMHDLLGDARTSWPGTWGPFFVIGAP